MVYKKDQLTPYVPDGAKDQQSASKSSDKNQHDAEGQEQRQRNISVGKDVSKDIEEINSAFRESRKDGRGLIDGSFDEHLWLDSDDEQDAEATVASILADAQAYADAHNRSNLEPNHPTKMS